MLLHAMQLKVLLLVLCLRFIVAVDTFCTPENLARFGTWPKDLDSGLYWFGSNDQAEKAGSSSPKFYDANKPTMIYFHGWTGAGNGWTSVCKRITTRCHPDICPDGGGQLLVNDWLGAGWNVGLFYWDQFADEACVRDAEQKIWFDRHGDGFRWKSYNVGSGVSTYRSYEHLQDTSVADMCARQVKLVMGSYRGPQTRFVGHSLGAQLAVKCAALLHADSHPAAPQRLALLEPYFSKHSHMVFFGCHGTKVTTSKGLDDFAPQRTLFFVKNLWKSKKVVTEIYKSSILTEADRGDTSAYDALKKIVKNGAADSFEDVLVGNLGGGIREHPLERAATLVKYEPDWCSSISSASVGDVQHLGCRHCAVMAMYLLGFGRSAPPLSPPPALSSAQPGSALSSCMTPSASCTDGQLREWVQRQLDMREDQSWNQLGGRMSFDQSDDSFAISPSLEQSFQLGLHGANEIVEQAAKELQPANEDPPWRRVVTSSQFIIAMAAVFVLGTTILLLCASRRLGNSGDDSEAEEEDEQLKVSRFGLENSILAKGYENLNLAHASDHGHAESFSSAGPKFPELQPVQAGYGRRPP